MEIYENKTVLYEFTEEEANLHKEMLISIYTYLSSPGFKVWSLTSSQFDHLKVYIEKFEAEPQQEIFIHAETATVESDYKDFEGEIKVKKGKETKRRKQVREAVKKSME